MINESPRPGKSDFREESPLRKREQWDRKMGEMLRPDTYGYVLDAGIRDVVVALQLLGFNTTQSDQGNYSDSPWVEVMADLPRNVYEGEEALKTSLMAAGNTSAEEIDPRSPRFDRAKQVDIEGAARESLQAVNAAFTPEYEEWRKTTLESAEKLQRVIDEFYSTRLKVEGLRVAIDFPYRTSNHPPYIGDIPFLKVTFDRTSTDEDSEEKRQVRVTLARQEMDRFTEYLKERFFQT